MHLMIWIAFAYTVGLIVGLAAAGLALNANSKECDCGGSIGESLGNNGMAEDWPLLYSVPIEAVDFDFSTNSE